MKRLSAALLLWFLLAACANSEKPFSPMPLPRAENIMLISIDALRADHLGSYGYPRPTSPNLDRFAAEAIRFKHAYTSANWTLPGHAGMLTGLMSSGHRAIGIHDMIRTDAHTVTEQLAQAGYSTAAFTSHIFVSEKFGFHRGFGTFEYEQLCPGTKLTDKTIGWLDKAPAGKPFFLFLHYFDVHIPYGREGAPVKKFAAENCKGPITWSDVAGAAVDGNWDRFKCFKDLYDADIALVDQQLGRLFKYLKKSGRLDRTLIIVTSDHGELFGEQYGASHGITMFEPEIQVPLLMRFPKGASGGTVVDAQVSTIQLAPTILEAAGQSTFPTDLPGLMPLLQGRGKAPEWITVESRKTGPDQIAVLHDGWKAMLPPPYNVQGLDLMPLLYDLKEGEKTDQWAKKPELSQRLYDLAARSGWYGKGACYEIIYVPGQSHAALNFEITMPEGLKPVSLTPFKRTFERKGTKVIPVERPMAIKENTITITLSPAEMSSGFSLVVSPPDAQVIIRIPGITEFKKLPLFVGQSSAPFKEETIVLHGPTGPMITAQKVSMSGFVQIHGYEVLHLNRPNMGSASAPVELSPQQRETLRSLGYI